MARLAEQLDADMLNFELDFLEDQLASPLAEAIPDRPEDATVRARAAQFIGACIAERTVRVTSEKPPVQPIESLYDAIQQAALGNETARKMITANVATDVIERSIKAGHVMEVALGVDGAGRIQQFGQRLETVQANTLRHAADNWQKLERTKAEAVNSFRMQQALESGELRDHSFVVLSRAADNMSEQQMNDEGFFTDTMSMAIQVTTERDGQLVTETAFVAGVNEPGGHRHDKETVVALGLRLGVDLRGKTAAEVLATPLLVPNSELKNGVIDLVALYDDCAGGTFFGQTKPRQNYLYYRQQCREREAQLQPIVETITDELIDEATTINDPVQATQRLNKLSGKHLVQQAVFDETINARVFGAVAEAHIMAARLQVEAGNLDAAVTETALAVQTEKSRSCPGGADDKQPEEKMADCEFVSKKCPVCGEANAKTKVSNGHFYHVGRKCKA